jgi:hypothetical protein
MGAKPSPHERVDLEFAEKVKRNAKLYVSSVSVITIAKR